MPTQRCEKFIYKLSQTMEDLLLCTGVDYHPINQLMYTYDSKIDIDDDLSINLSPVLRIVTSKKDKEFETATGYVHEVYVTGLTLQKQYRNEAMMIMININSLLNQFFDFSGYHFIIAEDEGKDIVKFYKYYDCSNSKDCLPSEERLKYEFDKFHKILKIYLPYILLTQIGESVPLILALMSTVNINDVL